MSIERRTNARQAGRLLEGKLVFVLIGLIAIGIAVGTVTQIILPAFAQIEAAFDAARPAR